MSAPVFDETLRDFLPAAPAPPGRSEPPGRAAEPAAPAGGKPQASGDRADRIALFQACLGRLKRTLDIDGKAEDAALVGELIDFLGRRELSKAVFADADHRPIYAVCAAFIAALANISVDEAAAAQALARKLVLQGYELPKHGGDARGWKRLLLWRDQLVRGRMPELREVYERALAFARQAPTAMDLKAALDYALAGDRAA